LSACRTVLKGVYLYREQGYSLRRVDVVPDCHVVPALGHYHVRPCDPLDKSAVVQYRRLVHGLDVDEVETAAFVAKQELLSSLVQFEPVNLGVMGDLGRNSPNSYQNFIRIS
jgi:hypothetical protein